MMTIATTATTVSPTTTTMARSSIVANRRTTFAQLLQLFTIPVVTLPPPPNIDTYGINTIPELPPQHESIYKGMFAPDGSLIKKNTAKENLNTKQTAANENYDDDKSASDVRGLDLRTADDPVRYDGYNFSPDEKYLNEHEESMIDHNFLRKNMPHHSKGNKEIFSAKLFNDDKGLILFQQKVFPSDDATQIIASSTASIADSEKSRKIFRRSSDRSPIKVFPKQAVEQSVVSETNTIQSSTWLNYENGNLDRTTIQPNLILRTTILPNHHFVFRTSIQPSQQVVVHAAIQPEQHFVLHDSENGLFENGISPISKISWQRKTDQFELKSLKRPQKLMSKSSILEKLHEKNSTSTNAQPVVQNVLVTPMKRYYNWNLQHDHFQDQSLRYRPRQQSPQYQLQQQLIQYQPQSQPLEYQPRQLLDHQPQQQSLEYQPQQKQQLFEYQPRQLLDHQPQQQSLEYQPQQKQQLFEYQPRQQQSLQYQHQQQPFQYQLQQQPLQYQPKQQPILYQPPPLQYQIQQQHFQYQSQQQQQQPYLTRDPEDEAYLREVEEYDHFWENQRVRNAQNYQSQTATLSPNFQPAKHHQQQQQHYPLQKVYMSDNYNNNIGRNQLPLHLQQQQHQQPQKHDVPYHSADVSRSFIAKDLKQLVDQSMQHQQHMTQQQQQQQQQQQLDQRLQQQKPNVPYHSDYLPRSFIARDPKQSVDTLTEQQQPLTQQQQQQKQQQQLQQQWHQQRQLLQSQNPDIQSVTSSSLKTMKPLIINLDTLSKNLFGNLLSN